MMGLLKVVENMTSTTLKSIDDPGAQSEFSLFALEPPGASVNCAAGEALLLSLGPDTTYDWILPQKFGLDR